MNRTITVDVVKEFARQDSQNGGIQGSGNVDHLRLRFSKDWDGYAKTCVFWDANGENPVKVIVGADKMEDVTKDPRTYIIDIPPEPLAVEGTYTVVIDGYLDGKRGRSETIRLKSNGAQITDDAGEPADPTPSQAEQLQQEIEKIIPNMQAVAIEAKSWAVGGTGSRDGEDTDNSKYYAQQSEESAQKSEQSAEEASQQAEEAKNWANAAEIEADHAARSQIISANYSIESEKSAQRSEQSAEEAEQSALKSAQSSDRALESAENAEASAQKSEEAKQAIENMTVSAISVGPNADPYVNKTNSGGVVNLEFGLRDGRDGRDGDPGPPGYTVTADGLYAFHIDDNGDLIITYTGDKAPPFSIDENGDLIYTLEGNEVNIGHVVGGGGGGSGGTSNYNDLTNKPSINGVQLSGNKTSAELGIQDGAPGEAATITISSTETVAAGTPAAFVELSGSTPQNRLYKAQIPQGPQGPAGEGVPSTEGVPDDYVLTPAGWAKPSGGFSATVETVPAEDQNTWTIPVGKKYIILPVGGSANIDAANRIGSNALVYEGVGVTVVNYGGVYAVSYARNNVDRLLAEMFVVSDTCSVTLTRRSEGTTYKVVKTNA